MSSSNSQEVRFGDFAIRRFNPTRDLPNVLRVWRECGWIRNDSDEIYTEHYYSVGDPYVATLDDGAECACHVMPGFCLLYTSPSPRDKRQSRMPSSA